MRYNQKIMQKDQNSSNIVFEKVYLTISAQTQTQKEKNTHVECLEDLTATIPMVRVITDVDRTAFLEDDDGY